MKSVVADYRYRTLCLRIVPKVGSAIYLTQYPRDLVMGGHTYLSASGYEFTGYTSSTNLSPAMIDVEGIAGLAGIGYDEIASGVFDGARAFLFATSWRAPVEDEEQIVQSILGKITMMDGKYKIEEMALIDVLNQTIGDTYTASCLKTFGGQEYAGCMIALGPLTVTGTITSVTGTQAFTDNTRGEATDYFVAGTVAFTSGANMGLKPLEIRKFTAGGLIETFDSFHYLPQVGDTYVMIPGCRRRREDCIAHGNILNFGGFSDIPTTSTYAQVGTL